MRFRMFRDVMVALAFLVALSPRADAQSATPSPAPSAVPAVTWQVNVSGYSARTNNPNATGAVDTMDGKDLGSRTDYSSILAGVVRSAGTFRFAAMAGEYAFPVVGQALNPTFKAGVNTDVFSFVPIAYVQYVPNSTWTFSAGKLPTLIGQENVFTFQNANVQRGLAWNQETTISRGVRATYTQGKLTANLEYNDGLYSGRLSAVEGAAQWSASPDTWLTFAFVVPQANTIPNPTAGIANKRIGALMMTQHFGKLVLTPYVQWLDSPGNAAIGFNGDERAFSGVMIAAYQVDSAWSLGARYESLVNRSSATDPSLNADFIGFGPGSRATTWTLTPSFHTGHTTMRLEFSSVNLGAFTPGLGFGTAGTASSQSRALFELGLQF